MSLLENQGWEHTEWIHAVHDGAHSHSVLKTEPGAAQDAQHCLVFTYPGRIRGSHLQG